MDPLDHGTTGAMPKQVTIAAPVAARRAGA
jgi:hypothetical protein